LPRLSLSFYLTVALVAGAVIALQGVHERRHGASLSPAAMRALLQETGTPQTGLAHIGPLPHAGRALERLGRR